MHGIKHQSSAQAAAIIRNAIQRKDLELIVSRSGNVRLAYGPEKFFLGLVNAVDSCAREKRIDSAKSAVINKLTAELEALGIETSTKKMPLVEKLAESLVAGHSESNSASNPAVSVIEKKFSQALVEIRKVSEQAKDKSLKYFWKAIEHDRGAGRKPDVNRALSIAQTTIKWAKDLGVNERSAFNSAINAHQLMHKKGLPLEEGKEILLMAGRLSTRHQFSEDAALQFAIDNYPLLRVLGVRMDSIERTIKSLDEQVPELRRMPQITRISAAIRYLQLIPAASAELKPVDEIRKSLADLPLLQQAMPRGCKINQIHQGSHIRGISALEQHHFKEVSDRAASLDTYPLFRGPTVHGVRLPKIFGNFEKQHVEDLVRGFSFDLCDEGKPNEQFAQLENKRRANPKQMTEDAYKLWAETAIQWAGSAQTAESISRFESQSFFGDIETVTSEHLRNSEGYAVKAFGEGRLSKLGFRADRKRMEGPESFELKATRYVNASLLSATPAEGSQDSMLPRSPLQLPLLPNPDDQSVANQNAFSVKREYVVEANADDLAKGLTNCRVIAVKEEWDIKLDWDSWRSQRNDIGVL
jgi:hypothetical protein